MNINICKKCKYKLCIEKNEIQCSICCVNSLFENTFGMWGRKTDKIIINISDFNILNAFIKSDFILMNEKNNMRKIFHPIEISHEVNEIYKKIKISNKCPYYIEHELSEWNIEK
jgi:hypothetical protein